MPPVKAPSANRPSSWPVHPLLAALPPVLEFTRENLDRVPPRSALPTILVATAVVCAMVALLTPLFRDLHRAALAVTLLTFGFFANRLVPEEHFFLPWVTLGYRDLFWGALAVAFAAAFPRGRARRLGAVLNVALLSVCVVQGGQLIRAEGRRSAKPVGRPGIPTLPSTVDPSAPDVYCLLLDGYGRADVLLDTLGFANPLTSDLRQAGFFVADRAIANYAQTSLALAAALNFDYLPALADLPAMGWDRRGLSDLIGQAALPQLFRRAGYRVVALGGEYSPSRLRSVDREARPLVRIDEFSSQLLEGSALTALFAPFTERPRVAPLDWLRHRQVTWQFDRLASGELGNDGHPTLVLAHVLTPHPPFVFAPDTGLRATSVYQGMSDGNHWYRYARGSGERYRDGYVASIQSVNWQVRKVLAGLDARAERPTVVILFGDHGPGSRLVWEHPELTDLRERMSILWAERWPTGNQHVDRLVVSPVNGLRRLARELLGVDLPDLPDRAYFSRWSRPYDFLDVTELALAEEPKPSVGMAASPAEPRASPPTPAQPGK